MRCAICGEPIEVGEVYYNIDGDHIHRDCIMDYLNEFCKVDGGYEIEGEVVTEEELDDCLYEFLYTCNEEEELADPRYEPEYWEDR